MIGSSRSVPVTMSASLFNLNFFILFYCIHIPTALASKVLSIYSRCVTSKLTEYGHAVVMGPS